ncbi:uncharacterized protein LOC131656924 [Vicia villosa]|uniref:uncharacterized protein LOC131656924 n=1 Tax=Vicia villosa TaxID=3911 RepID=UPI00273C7D10|nr:uncharacterized protein LOC131656924 [Vicia villosa]
MEFNSLDEFREAIREWSVFNGREIKFVKNESYRVRVECRTKCGFLILCSKVGHKHTFAIKTIVDKHTCARVLDNRSASSRWVAKAVVKKMQTSQSVRITDIIQDLRQNFSVGITVARAWKAKLIAKRILEGDADRQYADLRRYASELHRVNPGNTVSITVNRPSPSIQPRFGSFYFCFDGCKKGFTNGCRPFIGVDGCHLKTKYGGQLLIVVGRDPNDQYFPLAFGVVEIENKETWKWFIDLLMGDIGQDNRYVFISDQQKGLVSVFEDMGERVEQRLCLRHLYANFKKKFGGGALIRDLMMGAAKATYYQGWMTKMNELKELDPKAWSEVIPTDATQASEVIPTDATQATEVIPTDPAQTDYFDGISDDIITSLPDITTAQNYKEANKKKKLVKELKPMRKRSSERIKINWFKKPKPFTGPGSNSDQPMSLTDEEEGSGSKKSNKKAKK